VTPAQIIVSVLTAPSWKKSLQLSRQFDRSVASQKKSAPIIQTPVDEPRESGTTEDAASYHLKLQNEKYSFVKQLTQCLAAGLMIVNVANHCLSCLGGDSISSNLKTDNKAASLYQVIYNNTLQDDKDDDTTRMTKRMTTKNIIVINPPPVAYKFFLWQALETLRAQAITTDESIFYFYFYFQ
jgi:hypothetical protein